nr:flagellar hook-length control protein FliK [Succinivibrionaceae bacterium]
PAATPGAAQITQGQDAPLPDKSVVEDIKPAKEGGFLRRIASIFSGHGQAAAPAQAAPSTAAAPADPLSLARQNPLDVMLYALRAQAGSANLPPAVREQAQNFLKQIEQPLDGLESVKGWLNFTAGPMSDTSPRAIAMHQWAFSILCMRFANLGKAIDRHLRKAGRMDLKEALTTSGKSADAKALSDLAEETLGEIARMQKLAQPEPGQAFPRYIPLPPTHDGGREGSMSAQHERDDQGRDTWHLNFTFDPQGLGLIQIKAVAQLPEIKLSCVTETLAGLQKVQELMPQLREKLQDLGVTTRSVATRLGHIAHEEKPHAEAPKGQGGDGLSINI